jgi:hypothetical protein
MRALAFLVFAGCVAPAPSKAEGTLSQVIFTATSPLSGNAELARRMLSPLKNAALAEMIAKGARLADQPVDPAKETFALYVPTRAPANGYGLVVFVPPWNAARLPDGWGPVLDQYGIIFVSAAKSGNDQNVLARREPLALLGYVNAAQRYHLDPARIIVAGFSGGSRIALRLALGYPDVFRGAILDAGSDPIATTTIPLPPRDLFARFQEASHLVYLTGDQDTAAVAADMASLHSLRDWCVFGVDQRSAMNEGHDAMGGAALGAALDLLAKPAASDAAKLASCRAGIDAAMKAQLAQARALATAGQRDEARHSLSQIDAHYGGLAAPDSIELAKSIGSP